MSDIVKDIARLKLAADRVLDEWAALDDQEMYGEMLREGWAEEDRERWLA